MINFLNKIKKGYTELHGEAQRFNFLFTKDLCVTLCKFLVMALF